MYRKIRMNLHVHSKSRKHCLLHYLLFFQKFKVILYRNLQLKVDFSEFEGGLNMVSSKRPEGLQRVGISFSRLEFHCKIRYNEHVVLRLLDDGVV